MTIHKALRIRDFQNLTGVLIDYDTRAIMKKDI